MASDEDDVAHALPPVRRRRRRSPEAAPAAQPRVIRRRAPARQVDNASDSDSGSAYAAPGPVAGGGGRGAGPAVPRGLHFDPDEPVREDEEEVVSIPLDSIRWTLQPQYQAQLPLSDWCFMCELRQDNNNPF
mgnify:CR=1 FL=1